MPSLSAYKYHDIFSIRYSSANSTRSISIYLQGVRTTPIQHHKMDNRPSKIVMGIPAIQKRRLLSSETYQPNGVEREDVVAVSIRNHLGLGPRFMEMVKHRLIHGSRIIPLGSGGKIFRKSFSITDDEKLVHASRCYIYTTAGEIAGILFISTKRIGFCSDRSLKTYSTTGELLKFQYKVSIPLEKINGLGESMNFKRPSNKYLELVTLDDFSFWFLGFPNYKKTLRCIRERIGQDCLSD